MSNADNGNIKEVRNKSTIVFKKCKSLIRRRHKPQVFPGEYARRPRSMPIRPYGFGLAPDSEPCSPIAEELKTFTGISKEF